MESKELLQYIKDAISQETDILQQERIIAEYDELQRERKPVLKTETKPEEPAPKEYDQPMLALILTIILAVSGLQILPASLSALSNVNERIANAEYVGYILSSDRGMAIFGIVAGIICLVIGVAASWYIITKRKARREENEYAASTYKNTCQQIDKRNKKAEAVYEHDLRDWKQTNAEMNVFMQKPLEDSRRLLQRYYASDVIYPKYCTLPALTSIYEYFVTGRCTELTGPHGAYNLYEDELRKDTVISQLNTVIENLEQIRHNQYMLYQQVKSINENTQTIVSELQQIKGYTVQLTQLTALNAYYAALNERNTRITMYYHL